MFLTEFNTFSITAYLTTAVQAVSTMHARTSMHFLKESVRFHFQDFGKQCIILAFTFTDKLLQNGYKIKIDPECID